MNGHRLLTAILAQSAITICGCAALAAPAKKQSVDEITVAGTPIIFNINDAINRIPAISPELPPSGSGFNPPIEIPGSTGPIPASPSQIPNVPLASPLDMSEVNAYLAPYLVPPPSATGDPPPILKQQPGCSPVAVEIQVPINGGPLPNYNPPISRTGRQTTADYGTQQQGLQAPGNSAMTTDFGQSLYTNPNNAKTPQISQDAPRQGNHPGLYNCQQNEQPNLPNAFFIHVNTGTHTLFRGTMTPVQIVVPPPEQLITSGTSN